MPFAAPNDDGDRVPHAGQRTRSEVGMLEQRTQILKRLEKGTEGAP
jgi:hypothetical protein